MMGGSIREKLNSIYDSKYIKLTDPPAVTPPPPQPEPKRDLESRIKTVTAIVTRIIVETKGDYGTFFSDIFLSGNYKTKAQLEALDIYQKRTMAHHSQHLINQSINLLVENLKKTLLYYDKPADDDTKKDLSDEAYLNILFNDEQKRITFRKYQENTKCLDVLQSIILKSKTDKEAQNLNFALSQSIMALQSALLAQTLKQPALIAKSKKTYTLLRAFSDYAANVILDHVDPKSHNYQKNINLKYNIITHPEYAALDVRTKQMLLNITGGMLLGLMMGILLTTLVMTTWSILSTDGGLHLLKTGMYIHEHMSMFNSLFYDGVFVPVIIGSGIGLCVGGASTAFNLYKAPRRDECVGLQDKLFTAAIERADTVKSKPNVM